MPLSARPTADQLGRTEVLVETLATTALQPAGNNIFADLPVYSLAANVPYRTSDEAVQRYRADRRLMIRNLICIGLATIGWSVALQIITPLIAVRLMELGVRENVQGTIQSLNLWAVSFLVMLFGWMSDHTISRFGRRKPYLYISAPFIIFTIAVFPFFVSPQHVPLLLSLQVVYLLFMDLKNSTFSLIIIDCVPGPQLARATAVITVVTGLVFFFANRYAAELMKYGDRATMLLSACVMLLTTFIGAFVVEPPIVNPRKSMFRPWSTFQTTANYDKRLFVLMLGIALLFAFPSVSTQWLWLWSTETLKLTRADTFQAVSWAGLANVVLAFPIGWVVDRYGGLKIVVAFQALCIICFAIFLMVQTKSHLTWLVIAQTITFPMYWSADLLVFKSVPSQNIGAITSTNSCIRNAFLAVLSLITGWTIYWSGHDYRIGFTIGLVLTTVGFFLCIYHQRVLTRVR